MRRISWYQVLGSSVLCLALMLLSASCGPTATRRAQRQHVGTPYAKIADYMKLWYQVEYVPGQVRHDSVRDEATLVSMTPVETCFDVVVRTASGYDEPLDMLSPRCVVDGKKADAMVSNEMVGVTDYQYTGQVEKVWAQAVLPTQLLSLSMSEPTNMIFRVIERSARVCCPAGGMRQAELIMVSPRMLYNNGSYKLDFEWQLQ